MEVCDPHHGLSLLDKMRQSKSETVQVYAEKLHTLAHDTFMKLNKAVVESNLVIFFIDGLYHNMLQMKIMRENSKHFKPQYSLHWQNKISEKI